MSTDGALFAVIGPNGAGKTTLFNMISGFVRRRPSGDRALRRCAHVTGAAAAHEVAMRGLIRTYQLVQLFKDHDGRRERRWSAPIA